MSTYASSRHRATWRTCLRVFGAPLLLALILLLCARDANSVWAAPSLFDPLGTDEFGRDLLGTAIKAAGASLLKGLLITTAVMVVSLLAAEFLTLSRSWLASEGLRIVSRVMESVPVVMWVMIVVIVLEQQRSLVGGIVYAVVVLPTAVTILSGELFRLRHREYVEAAYLMGVAESRVLMRHLLPAMGAVLLPFAVQILGGAIAVDGAIGVIGQGSREQLDLGMFLIRGKESFQIHPQVLLVAIGMYLAIYAYLLQIARLVDSPKIGDAAA